MPSRRSPSQRTPEGRQGRQMAALSTGTNAGRLISASRSQEVRTSTPVGDPNHASTGGVGLWVGPDEPTDGSVFWYDTDETC